MIIRDSSEAKRLASYIKRETPIDQFFTEFAGRSSRGFDPALHLQRIGVVNQTTMLATETQEISDLLKTAVVEAFPGAPLLDHFADTRDTLCYATLENQNAIQGLIESGGDIAVVVGGYNSSNTSHLVELCENHIPTYYVKDAEEIIDKDNIRHLIWRTGEVRVSTKWLPYQSKSSQGSRIDVLVTAGASCPDVLVAQVVEKIAGFYGEGSVTEGILGISA